MKTLIEKESWFYQFKIENTNFMATMNIRCNYRNFSDIKIKILESKMCKCGENVVSLEHIILILDFQKKGTFMVSIIQRKNLK